MYDVIIIGAGVVGCAIARELSRFRLQTAVLEKCGDIGEGTSKANSGIVHGGYDAREGTLMARLNIQGSRRMEALSRELDFPYRRNGSLVLCFDEKDLPRLAELEQRGIRNGVEQLAILNREQVLALEPAISERVVAALHVPTGAIVCPFGLTIALAENAAMNGVTFQLNTEVTRIEKQPEGYRLSTSQGVFEARTVVNAAGVYGDRIHNMICRKEDRFTITPRRGEYLLYDKEVGNLVSHTLFQLPTGLGKGILVTPTVHGNLLTGPTAEDLPEQEKEGTRTTARGMAQILSKAALSIAKVPDRQVITSFAGLRAHGPFGDFLIGELPGRAGFFDVAGIESPGLSCAPAIGEYVAEMVGDFLKAKPREDFLPERKGIPSMAEASPEERQRLIEENPAFAHVICRCELVTEGEILAAIHRPVGATTVDGIKRRTRAGMGRCQAGFCLPKTIQLLARELGVEESQIRKSGEESCYLLPEEGGSL